MYCSYCGVHYGLKQGCLCLPPFDGAETDACVVRVNGPWGEAIAEWSVVTGTGEAPWRFVAPPAQA